MRAEPGIVAELKRIAGVDADEFSLVHQGVKVRLIYRGMGGESRLELRADYDAHARAAGLPHGYRDAGRPVVAIRPMQIALRPERPLDRHHERQGIDVEHQTGDPAFDEAIYGLHRPSLPGDVKKRPSP